MTRSRTGFTCPTVSTRHLISTESPTAQQATDTPVRRSNRSRSNDRIQNRAGIMMLVALRGGRNGA